MNSYNPQSIRSSNTEPRRMSATCMNTLNRLSNQSSISNWGYFQQLEANKMINRSESNPHLLKTDTVNFRNISTNAKAELFKSNSKDG